MQILFWIWPAYGSGATPQRAPVAPLLSEYSHDTWQTDQGLPQNTVNAIVQTRDGYLWIGTREGLVRFDGVRFTVFDKANTPEIKNNRILALLEDRSGNLWIGTSEGLNRLINGKFSLYTTAHGLPSGQIFSLYEDSAGRLWVGAEGGLSRLDGATFKTYTVKDGLPDDRVTGYVAGECEGRRGAVSVGHSRTGAFGADLARKHQDPH